ncbi:MAG TPA: hypothetical protein VKU00_30300 [Chthonomonadaceae bacterium]|nr:hypothetical protein [Chthonomonadaceae bacterium]
MVVTGLLSVLCLTLLALVIPCYFRANAAQAAAPTIPAPAAVKHASRAQHSAHHRHRGHHIRL